MCMCPHKGGYNFELNSMPLIGIPTLPFNVVS